MRVGSISGSFGLAMGILARLCLAKIRTMARQNSPDIIPKGTKKVQLGIRIESLNGHSRLYFDHAINEPDEHDTRNGDCHFSFILHIFLYASDEARVLLGTRISLDDTRAKLHACHLAHHPRRRQTKATEILFVLLFKYVHSRDNMTRLACRVMARVPVCSPFYPKSRGGSHFEER